MLCEMGMIFKNERDECDICILKSLKERKKNLRT